MFSSKPKNEQAPTAPTHPATPEVEPEFQYQVFAAFGVDGWNKQMTLFSRQGWELVNGCMAGTAHYGYMRRRVTRSSSPSGPQSQP